MSLFHFHVTQVKRSAGQSAIASAAYRAGEKLYSEYYGETSDFTHKGGVVSSQIFLPSHAPPEYQDRAALWNAVEKAERGKKAQLAYSFDIALQNELTLEENIALARRFVEEQLVSRGMIADLAIHSPERENPNPHFHILCPIRPIELNGKWGAKQRRVYRLDENGDRIIGEDGKPLFDAVPTTDWGSQETLEHWREAWAEMVNAAFAEHDLNCRIDHRSYERQGVDKLPSVHEGPAVRQMEARGIVTDKGELNRWIKKTNALLGSLRKKIASLLAWLKEAKEELSKPQSPALGELLGAYYTNRNAGAWSQKAKVGNLKKLSETINYLTANNLMTVEDLENRTAALGDETSAIRVSLKEKSVRLNELQELLDLAKAYQETKPIHDEMNAIRWKSKRDKFKQEHDGDLRRFYAVRRRLDKHLASVGALPVEAWTKELRQLRREYDAEYEQYKPIQAELKKLWSIKQAIDTTIRSGQGERPRKAER